MNLSLGELEALCRKAARGAGLDWGPAEDAGQAVRRLVTLGLPGEHLLLLRLQAHDRVPAHRLAPRAFEHGLAGAAGALCPILAGAALSDGTGRLRHGAACELHDVASPLLLLPFAAQIASRLAQPVGVAWHGLTLVSDGRSAWAAGTLPSVNDPYARRVQIATTVLPESAPLAAVGRASTDAACIRALDRFAQRTYAPATQASRERGAG